jgi:hypothetical protein
MELARRRGVICPAGSGAWMVVEGRPFTGGDRATSAITRAYVKLAAAASSPTRIQGCGGVQLQAPRDGGGAPRHSAAPRSCVRAPYVSLRYRKSPDVFAACGRPMARGGASAGRSAWASPGGVTARAAGARSSARSHRRRWLRAFNGAPRPRSSGPRRSSLVARAEHGPRRRRLRGRRRRHGPCTPRSRGMAGLWPRAAHPCS